MRKRYLDEELRRLFGRITAELSAAQRYFVIKNANELAQISLADVLYFEVSGHYITVHTRTEALRYKGSMAELEAAYKGGSFVRCHASFLVNCAYIERMEKNVLLMQGGDRVPISRSRLHDTQQAFIADMQRHLL